MSDEKFSLLRRILKALGLSEERIDELIGWIQTWLHDDEEQKTGKASYPYRLRDDFLTPAEANFYRVLQTATDWAIIAPKVSLGDLFYAQTGDYGQNRVFMNKIDRKHVDFLLCDPATLRPILGVELDDRSHQRKDRQQRDRFVDGVFGAAGLPIAHVPVRHGYQVAELKAFLQSRAGMPEAESTAKREMPTETAMAVAEPACPTCGAPMVLRTARKGPNAGGQFWGCSKYPQCRGILDHSAA
jgi:hypothetical protein